MQAIDVVIVTWPNHPERLRYFCRTLAALRNHLTASRHALHFLVSSESEHDPDNVWCGDDLEEICQETNIPLFWHDGPASLGAGMNAALQACTAPTIFLVQDDYELLYPLDLSPGAEMLSWRPDVDLIRYTVFTPPTGGTEFTQTQLNGFREVNISGPWPYGDEPHLRTPRMVERHGWYNEAIGHGAESDMVHRLVRNRAVIYAADKCYFGHRGQVSAVPLTKETRERAVSR